MGTLTGNIERLPGYCEHKLPTSCRLTSIPNCCACADERAHSASYSTYIDGVGFVLRGNRWQRYCWFCKEFWENRVKVSGLRPGQTRIPEVPDQTAFLERWYEFHRGYRIVKKEDGGEERVSVLGEDWREVSPGCLPRTLEEMREGRRREEVAAEVQVQQNINAEDMGPSLDDTLEGMFQAASLEESDEGRSSAQPRQERTIAELPAEVAPRRGSNVHAQVMVPAGSRNREYQARRVAALRRELHRMRNGIERVISGLRELGENVPDHSDATNNLTELGRTLDTINGGPSQEEADQALNSVNQLTSNTAASQSDRTLANMQARVDVARAQVNDARRSRDQAASELDLAENEFQTSNTRLQQLQREQRTAENYMRIFGTREEMAAQGENYESPIGGMFRRADERFRAAEDVRREERTLRQVLDDEARTGGEDEPRRLAELEGRERDVWGVPYQRPEVQAAQQRYAAQGVQLPGYLYQYPSTYPPSTSTTASSQPPQGQETPQESALEDYYRMMRQQEGAQLSPESDDGRGVSDESFPRTMLNAIMEARRQELEHPPSAAPLVEATASNRLTAADWDEWWQQDAEYVLTALVNNDQLRDTLGLNLQILRAQLRYVQENVVDERNLTNLESLLRNPLVIWQTSLPGEWLDRRKASVELLTDAELLFAISDNEVGTSAVFANHHNAYMRTEIVAQAFQMSAEVRRKAIELTPPERLSMLYRLQAGHREERDVAVLERLQANEDSRTLAFQTYNANMGEEPEQWTNHARRYDNLRRQRAREGDHSREELNASRQATSAFALAAGRQAMRTGSQTLLQRMAESDAETRAAYQRLQANGFTDSPRPPSLSTRITRPTLYRQLTLDDYGSSPPSSASEPEEDQEQGLDARDSGRPEPKTEEDLMVSMECKICYTQTAEVACLPCGHLVMCRWCSDQHSPTLRQDRTRPRRAAGCPVCRKAVRQKVRVFRV